MYIHTNPNPNGVYVEDCVVRAISIATGRSWDDIYVHICLQGFIMKNMPSVNRVWGTYLAKGVGRWKVNLSLYATLFFLLRDS